MGDNPIHFGTSGWRGIIAEAFTFSHVRLASPGMETLVCGRPDPTPAISHEIIHSRLDGGINITASHNPAEYNGLKFSSADGAPALPEVTKEIEAFVTRVQSGEYS